MVTLEGSMEKVTWGVSLRDFSGTLRVANKLGAEMVDTEAATVGIGTGVVGGGGEEEEEEVEGTAGKGGREGVAEGGIAAEETEDRRTGAERATGMELQSVSLPAVDVVAVPDVGEDGVVEEATEVAIMVASVQAGPMPSPIDSEAAE
jgi:hypothetical protein